MRAIGGSGAHDAIAYAAGLLLGLSVLLGFGFGELRAERHDRNDFTYVWLGPRLILDGGDPYSPADIRQSSEWAAVRDRRGEREGPENVFAYPPWVPLGLLPLGALPYRVATDLWTYGGMVAAMLALGWLLRVAASGVPVVHTLAGLALFASQPGTANFWSGQWGFMLVAGSALGAAAVLRGSALFTLGALMLMGKLGMSALQIWALAAAAYVHARRAFWIGAGTLAVAVVGPLLLFPGWLGAMAGTIASVRLTAPEVSTLANGLRDLIGPAGPWIAAAVVLAAVALALRFEPGSASWLAVWLALSPVAAIWIWSYDLLVLIVPLVLASGVLARRSTSAAARFAALGFTFFLLAPPLLYVIANVRRNENHLALVPLAVLIMVLLALRTEMGPWRVPTLRR